VPPEPHAPIARPRRRIGTAAAAFAWLAAATFAAAQEAERPDLGLPPGVEIEYERLVARADGSWELEGPVAISLERSRIQADHVTLDGRRVVATGNVLVVWDQNRVFGARMTYDLDTERGTIEDAMGQVMFQYLFQAERVEKIGDDTVLLERATVTTCAQPIPYWSFRVSSARIRVNRYARMWNVRLLAKEAPMVYLPYLIWPVKRDRAAGLLLPELHSTQTRGEMVSQQLFIPIGRSADVTLLGRYYTEAGFGGGGEARLVPSENGHARLEGFFINDQVAGRSRYRAKYEQTQRFRNGFRMVADVELVSDFDYFTQFETDLDLITTPQILTRVEMSRNGRWTSLNVRELRREQLFADDSTLVQQTLPEIEWRGRSRRLGRTPFYLEFESSLASIQQRREDVTFSTTPPIDADYYRADLYPTIRMPISPVPWLDVAPQVSYRYTHYTQRLDPDTDAVTDRDIHRDLASAGVEVVGPKVFRVFGREGGSRYKHALEPRVRYAVGEEYEREGEIIRFDEVDRFSAAGNQVVYSLVQRLFARRPRASDAVPPPSREAVVLPVDDAAVSLAPVEGVAAVPVDPDAPPPPEEPVEIASLEISQRKAFDEDLSRADLDGDGILEATSSRSPISLTGRYNPSPLVSFGLNGSYDILYDGVSNVSGTGSVRAAVYRAQFSVTHTRDLALDDSQTGVNLNGGLSLFRQRLQLDAETYYRSDPGPTGDHFPSARVRVQYRTQCCTVLVERLTYDFAADEDQRRDVYVRFDLSGIGKLWDQRF
jgi:LPS-assembly protein